MDGRDYEQKVGKFRLRSWGQGHPVASELEHRGPGGRVDALRLHGVEELYDLKYAVERILSQLERDKHAA